MVLCVVRSSATSELFFNYFLSFVVFCSTLSSSLPLPHKPKRNNCDLKYTIWPLKPRPTLTFHGALWAPRTPPLGSSLNGNRSCKEPFPVGPLSVWHSGWPLWKWQESCQLLTFFPQTFCAILHLQKWTTRVVRDARRPNTGTRLWSWWLTSAVTRCE